jgi:nitroreductase
MCRTDEMEGPIGVIAPAVLQSLARRFQKELLVDAYDCIVSKRDSRSYSGEAISEETLQRILQAGRMAGSSKNTQPWGFIVIRDEDQKAAIAGCGDFAQHVPSAQVLIAVVLTPGGGGFDAGRAAQNMMLAAWSEGITSCPVALHKRECALDVLGLPDGHTPAMLLSFGYPESEASRHRGIARNSMTDLVHEERW